MIIRFINILEDLSADIMENINKFKIKDVENTNPFQMQRVSKEDFLFRYNVNLFVDNSNLDMLLL
jgi:hypothetical protein